MSEDEIDSIVVRYADETDLDYARRCATLPSTEAVGEVRRRELPIRLECTETTLNDDGSARLRRGELIAGGGRFLGEVLCTPDEYTSLHGALERAREDGWLPPIAAERLFEQRDTAIAEAQQLRERVRVAGSESRRLIGKAEAERDTAIRERDDWRKTALGLDEHITTQYETIRRLAEERDHAIADLKAFGGEVERLYEVEREAERTGRDLAQALGLLGEMVDRDVDDCRHYKDACVPHGFLAAEGQCPHARIRGFLAAVDADKEASDG